MVYRVCEQKIQNGQNAREERMKFLCVYGLWLGLESPENSLYIVCLRSTNEMLNWFCLNEVICLFTNVHISGYGGVNHARFGLNTGCKDHPICCLLSTHEVLTLLLLMKPICKIYLF